MNIVVVSPCSKDTGVTTIAGLIGLELSARGKNVCITHSSKKSEALYTYFKLDKTEDRTANTSRLIKLIRSEVIQPDEFSDYCKSVNRKLDIFSVYKGIDIGDRLLNDGEEDSNSGGGSLREFITSNSPYDYIIYDIDTDINEDNAKYLIEKADVIINVFEQSVLKLKKYRKNIRKINKVIKDKPQLVILNKYDSLGGDVKACASMLGLKRSNNWHCVRYNGWIRYATNNGKLRKLYDSMAKSDNRVIDIKSDIKEVVNTIQKVKAAARRSTINKK